jgi:hypothetical protein
MVGEDIAVDLGSVLRTAIRVVNAAFLARIAAFSAVAATRASIERLIA